ncbi:MAG: pantoate--beta-alanine ligase [Acidobacteria bacterium]|nr:pantoate--beta-alanine ligase [Acidobacteriota bacterium]MBV9625432.1 pantoate--beta-alanine ligase [Acidobacteriota bacterium]
MRLIQGAEEMRGLCRAAKARSGRLGFVPTMGALHAGHLSLVRAARAQSSVVAASIFVNPAQFGPREDYSRYPRNLESDCALFENEGVELVFAPEAGEMYREDSASWVLVEGLSERLCGRTRPGHFRGVATVVAKLFHIVEPDIAFFGQKDAAQVAIVRRMVRDLNFALAIVVCPIVREPDGLALSSRNAYLGPEERYSAPVLFRSLERVRRLFDGGERNSSELIRAAREEFLAEPAVRLDYLEVVDPDSLEPEPEIRKKALVAVAARIGSTRLIDNILLEP